MKIEWDRTAERLYETGVDHGVLYSPDEDGDYSSGVAWNGLTSVNETPSGAEATPVYADNIKYLNLISAEEFGGTIEALYYPDEFIKHDGGVQLAGGVVLGQQGRPKFGLSYRTLLGNADVAEAFGYKIHLVYGAQASPSERNYATVNDSPEAAPLSWELTTTPVAVTGHKPTALITIDSTKVTAANLAALEAILYGTEGTDPRLPLPDEVLAIFEGSATAVVAAAPTYDDATHTITVPATPNVVYMVGGEQVTGTVVLEEDQTVTVKAKPAAGYFFGPTSDDDWVFSY